MLAELRMGLRAISTCGRACNLFLAVLMVVLAALTFSINWWTVYFWDCALFGDAAYYILLDKGLCSDSKTGQDGSYDDCTTWQDIADTDNIDNDARDAANGYIDSNGLCKASLALIIIVLVSIMLQFIPIVAKITVVRYVQAIVLVLCTILLLAAIGTSSETYFTDVGNYAARSNCDSNASSPYGGYILAIFVAVLASSLSLCILFPCMDCIDTSCHEKEPDATPSVQI